MEKHSAGKFVTVRFPKTSLTYELLESDFSNRWAAALDAHLSQRVQHEIIEANYFGSAVYCEVDLREKIQACVDTVNQYRAGSIVRNIYPNMTQTDLSALHSDFELLEPHKDYRIPIAPGEVRSALYHLNIHIHQYESLRGPRLSHIGVYPRPPERFTFEEEDYKLFTPNIKEGYIYLAYGVTGVPPLSCFQHNSAETPVPQYNYTPGFEMQFRSNNFNADPAEIKNWFWEKWAIDATDSKLAFGYIPLAKITDFSALKASTELILEDRRILSVTLSGAFDHATTRKKMRPYKTGLISKVANGVRTFLGKSDQSNGQMLEREKPR